MIVRDGDEPLFVFMVMAGAARHQDGRLYPRGSYFGERGMLERLPGTRQVGGVAAAEDGTRCLKLGREAFEAVAAAVRQEEDSSDILFDIEASAAEKVRAGLFDTPRRRTVVTAKTVLKAKR